MNLSKAILENNLAVLQKRFPELAGRLKNAGVDPNIIKETPKTGLPVMKYRDQQGAIKFIHSAYDPLKEAGRAIDWEKCAESSFIVTLGFGYGYHILELARRLRPEQKLVVVEQGLGIFRAALEDIDYTALLEMPNVYFLVGESPVEAGTGIIALLRKTLYPHLTVQTFFPAFNLFPDDYNEIVQLIQTGLNNYISRHSLLDTPEPLSSGTNILLINCPIRLTDVPRHIPYGLGILAALLEKEGYNVRVLDINAVREPQAAIEQWLAVNNKWDIIGISGLVTTYRYQKALVPIIRRTNPQARIIAGGGCATSVPELVFEHMDIDVAVLGEGEISLLEVVKTLEGGRSLQGIRGIWYRENGVIYKNEPGENIEDLDSVPFPARHLLPLDRYLENSPILFGPVAQRAKRRLDVITTRGCPFNCNFCYHMFGRSKIRYRSPENVVEEIEMLIRDYDIDFISFLDENFTASKERVYRFAELIKAKNIKIPWGTSSRVHNVDRELLQVMKDSGCVYLSYGVESGSQEMLAKMNKKATVEQAKRAIELTREVGITAVATFIFGYPGETRQTIRETVKFCQDINMKKGFFFATPYPGTPLYEQVKSQIGDEDKFIDQLADAGEFVINLTDFSTAEMIGLKFLAENWMLEHI